MFEIPKLGDEDSHYDGSRAFTWLADICGLSVDLVSICCVFDEPITGPIHSHSSIRLDETREYSRRSLMLFIKIDLELIELERDDLLLQSRTVANGRPIKANSNEIEWGGTTRCRCLGHCVTSVWVTSCFDPLRSDCVRDRTYSMRVRRRSNNQMAGDRLRDSISIFNVIHSNNVTHADDIIE